MELKAKRKISDMDAVFNGKFDILCIMEFFVVFCINSVTGRGGSTAETPQALPHPVTLQGVSVEGLGPGVNHPLRATKCRGSIGTRQSSRWGGGGGRPVL